MHPRVEHLSADEGEILDKIRKLLENTQRQARVSNDQVRQYLEQVNHLGRQALIILDDMGEELQDNDRSSIHLAKLDQDQTELHRVVEDMSSIIYALLR